jgi:hypothetical protein
MVPFNECKNYEDDDGADYQYEPYTGRVYDMSSSYETRDNYNNNVKVGAMCFRCHSPMCEEHAIQNCPDMNNLHEPWCINDNSIPSILEKHNVNLEKFVGVIRDQHMVNHIGNELYKANKKIYDMMMVEQPYKIDDLDAVAAFKKKHEFATKIMPEAIGTGIDKAIDCANPWRDVDWTK